MTSGNDYDFVKELDKLPTNKIVFNSDSIEYNDDKYILDKKVLKVVQSMYTFISIDRDFDNKVMLKEVFDMLDELVLVLGLK